MKGSLLLGMLLLVSTFSIAQDDPTPEPTQRPDAIYRLFRTKNIYTFIKLNTATGQTWQVQWSTGDYAGTIPISLKVLCQSCKAGTFSLYPTANIYNLVLLNQDDGRTWDLQWSIDDAHRYVAPIP